MKKLTPEAQHAHLPFGRDHASKSKRIAGRLMLRRLPLRRSLMPFRLLCIMLSVLFCWDVPLRPQDSQANCQETATLSDECAAVDGSVSPQTAGQSPDNSQQKPADAKPCQSQGQPQKKTSNDRILWTMPNFLTMENAGNIPPMTAKEKFKVTARGVFDPFEFILTGFVAGLNQAADSNPTYGQGMQGYGKRYGTAYGDNLIENFMSAAVLPSLLHQDPRYYQLGHGGALRRTAHALSRVFITRSDSGQTQPNYSELGGAFGAAAISIYSYHPHSERGIGDVVSVWGTQISWDAATYVIKEFWPDLRKHAKRNKTGAAAPVQAPAAQ